MPAHRKQRDASAWHPEHNHLQTPAAMILLQNMNAATGFFDLQVNGYGGVDFNRDGLTAHDLHGVCQRLAADGVERILATIITDDLPRMAGRIRAIVELRRHDPVVAAVIAGIHVEGPFVNEAAGYRGAHPLEAVRPADPEIARELLDAGDGLVRVMTLAPERDAGLRTTAQLVKAGVIVAAGHSDASVAELHAAADEGLSMFTHLGNGCPMQMNRHDNIIQRALSLRHKLWLTFIADGHHIPLFALGNYLRAGGLDRCIVVTDGTAPSGMGPGRYTLGRWDVVVGPEMVAMAPDGSHLIGSASTMRFCAANLAKLGLSPADIRRLTCDNPKKAMGVK